MASHVRRQLIEAVAAALDGLDTTGAHVFQARLYPLQDEELPGLRIYAESEEAVPVTIHGPALIERTVEVRVEGVAKVDEHIEDRIDQIALEVESALAAGVSVGGKTVLLTYNGCEIEVSGEGEKPAGSIELRYSAVLFNEAGSPDVLS
jgi:hypothetical protein